MLCLGVLEARVCAGNAQPGLGGRVPNGPLNGRKYVALHLDKRRLVIGAPAHGVQVLNSRNSVLRILELGSNPQRGATNELVVLLVDDSSGNVSVYNVQREVERLRSEAELEMDLDEKIDQARAHVPLQFRLHIHGGRRGHCAFLWENLAE